MEACCQARLQTERRRGSFQGERSDHLTLDYALWLYEKNKESGLSKWEFGAIFPASRLAFENSLIMHFVSLALRDRRIVHVLEFVLLGKITVVYFGRSPWSSKMISCRRPGPYTRENIERGETKQTPPYGRHVCAVPSTRVQTFRRFLNAVSWTYLNLIKSIEFCKTPTS